MITASLPLILAVSCGDRITCAGVGLARVSPADTTIRVNDSFVARYEEGGTCGDIADAHYQAVPVIWHTVDSAVVAVDSSSGRVTARTVGNAFISSSHGLGVAVHVR